MARAEAEGTRAEGRAPGHRLRRAHSSGRTKGRHWGRSPSASGPTWAPLPRSASRPPRPAHCAGACEQQRLAGGERGRTAAANPEPVPPPARRAPGGDGPGPEPVLRVSEEGSEERRRVRHAGGNACPPPSVRRTWTPHHCSGRKKRCPRSHARNASFCGRTRDTGSGWGNLKTLPATSGN